MAELNLKQIIDRLNAEFTGETRKLVFWYDDKAEFAEDMETVELQNAKIYHLQPDNQFYTKYFLERVDKTTNYLIYAPFPKPDVRDNHLEDTMLYSRRFFADRASLLSVDLGIEEKYKPVIEKHIKFFANKERTQRFYDLEIENFNEENILVGLLSAVCKARTCSFEEVVRIVLTDGELVDNAFLQEFEKYDLLSAFWQLCEQHFGYTDTKPSLERLLVTLFVTYTGRYVQAELPAAWKSFVSYKSGNIIAFLDSLMNSVLYRDKYDALSAHVAKGLNVFSAFAGMRVDDLVECDTFLAVDQVLVKWLIGRLVSEDIGAIVNGFTIPELCEKRAKMHFGRKTGKTYQMLSSAYSMVKEADYHAADGLKPIIDRYLAADYNMDQQYRKFYYYYDQLESTESFEPLRELVENIYTNEYLACLLPAWNAGIQQDFRKKVRDFAAADQHRGGNALDRQTDLLEKFVLLMARNDNRDVVVFAQDEVALGNIGLAVAADHTQQHVRAEQRIDLADRHTVQAGLVRDFEVEQLDAYAGKRADADGRREADQTRNNTRGGQLGVDDH